MNTRNWIIFSVSANALLLGALGYNLTLRPEPPAAVPVAASAKPAPVAKLSRPERPAVSAPTSGKPDWRTIESDDYKVYIANLRAVGCPEETIRDLIIADVNKFYFQKLAPLMARAHDFKFWQAGASRNKLTAENRQQLRALEREKWALLKDLLGMDAEAEYRKAAYPAEYLNDELLLGFLPEAKRGQVREVTDRFSALEREVQARSAGMMSPKDRAELKRIRDQRQAELAGLLTPQEMEEYDLRNSTTAETLRSRLAGMQTTEDQFRQLFRAQKVYDDEFGGGLVVGSPGDLDKRQTAQKQLEDGVRSALGDQAYAEYKRAQDPAYRGLTEVSREFNLPAGVAEQVYSVKTAVDEQVRRILTDQSIPKDERLTALKTISDETEKALVQTMGQTAFDAYKQNGGAWIPTVNGNGFSYTVTDGNNSSTRAYRFSDSNGGAAAAAEAARILLTPPANDPNRVKVQRAP